MLAGTKVAAGLSYSVARPDMDFETYSESGFEFDPERGIFVKVNESGKPGLPYVGAYYYAMHPSTEVISLAYDLKVGGGPRLWTPAMPPPADLLRHISCGGEIEAHNANFEYVIWNYVCCRLFHWPELLVRQLYCSLAKARSHGLPGALDKAVDALRLPVVKDPAGKNLINLLTIPRKPTKDDSSLRARPAKHPERFTNFYKYNLQDIAAESALSQHLPELSAFERDVWVADQNINHRGVAMDVATVHAACKILDDIDAQYTAEIQQLTAGLVADPNKTANIKAFLHSRGVAIPNLQKDTVTEWLTKDLPPDCHRVIEIRQLTGLASVKKMRAIRARLPEDGRLRGLFEYCGAERTGRFAGRGPQPQNLYSGGPETVQCAHCGARMGASAHACWGCGNTETHPAPWDETAVDHAAYTLQHFDLPTLEKIWGDVLVMIAGCLRGMFVAAEGCELISSDYSAIEAVVAAMIAKEQWRIDVFRTHGKIYEAGASMITGIPLQEILDYKTEHGVDHPTRKTIGKVSELASGYAGWINAWKQFGADEFMTDDEIKKGVLAWREASPNIVEMWGGQWRKDPNRWHFTHELYGLEGAAIHAVQFPGDEFEHNGIGYSMHDDVLYCKLPSGRHLAYHSPELHESTAPHGHPIQQLSFMGYNSDASKGPIGWIRIETFGGRLFENVVQAIARDILAYAILALELAGYKVVLHVHDEVVVECIKGAGSLEEVERILSRMPPWAKDWPIKATGGWVGHRFRKG